MFFYLVLFFQYQSIQNNLVNEPHPRLITKEQRRRRCKSCCLFSFFVASFGGLIFYVVWTVIHSSPHAPVPIPCDDPCVWVYWFHLIWDHTKIWSWWGRIKIFWVIITLAIWHHMLLYFNQIGFMFYISNKVLYQSCSCVWAMWPPVGEPPREKGSKV